MCSAKNYSNQIREIIFKIEQDIKELNNNLHRLQKEQEDMLHIIETGGFNASQGYMLSKMLHDIRVQRRETKDELQTLEILKNNFTNHVSDKIDKLTKLVLQIHEEQIEAKNGNKYKPRVLNATNVKELLCV